jgi:hypothetical protein
MGNVLTATVGKVLDIYKMEDKELSRTRRKGWVHGYSGAYVWLKAEFWCFSHETVDLYGL